MRNIPPILFYDFLEGYPPPPSVSRSHEEPNNGGGEKRTVEALGSGLRNPSFSRGKLRYIDSY
jgi:hypothetical protein